MSGSSWDRLKDSFHAGEIIEVVVAEHAPFGVFVDLPDTRFRGLIEVVSLSDEPPDVMAFPAVGSTLEAVVLGFTEHEHQVRLSAKPSVVARARETP